MKISGPSPLPAVSKRRGYVLGTFTNQDGIRGVSGGSEYQYSRGGGKVPQPPCPDLGPGPVICCGQPSKADEQE